jgi:hypothetical protein
MAQIIKITNGCVRVKGCNSKVQEYIMPTGTVKEIKKAESKPIQGKKAA